MNPDQFNIVQQKEMGLWPPGDQVAAGIYPYIKRLKFPKIRVVDVGVMKGENATWLLELDVDKKIDKIFGVLVGGEDYFKDLAKENMSNQERFEFGYDPFKKKNEVEVVCINSKTDLDKTLKRYYHCVSPGGIFCGNDHRDPIVKEALTKFRRDNRIGTPINVSLGSWFWFVR